MNWQRLLSRKRVVCGGRLRETSLEGARSVFERDWDRLLFSSAFRRMHDKTQVFPLPDDDVVHSRLTHSLEVASVGRSLGKRVGRAVCERHAIPAADLDPHDIGDVIAAACLAHDIGNPPFGHAGEDAIATFFRALAAEPALAGLSPRERADLQAFEGNAQGFRVVTRLQLEADGGLQLTVATLGAFCKYPRESGEDGRRAGKVSSKKFGLFQDDVGTFEAIANELELPRVTSPGGVRAWARHPLAFLVEAADDICYSILDIEDAVRLRHVTRTDAEELLSAIAAKSQAFDPKRLAAFELLDDRIGYLRATAIGQMIEECTAVFVDAEAALLAGDFDIALADAIPSNTDLAALRRLARTQCYDAPSVIEIELAGYEALGGLLERFIPVAIPDDPANAPRPERERKALALLRASGASLDGLSRYGRILRVTDFVSGMTDRHALATYRRLQGIAIPGRVG